MLPKSDLLSCEHVLNLVIATNQDAQCLVEMRKLSLNQSLIEGFTAIAKKYLDGLQKKELVPYNPEVAASDKQCLTLDLTHCDAIRRLITSITHIANIQPYETEEPKFIKRLNFYALVLQVGSEQVVLFREFKSNKVLSFGKELTAVFTKASGTFQPLEESLFRFDSSIDCVAYQGKLFITNSAAFMRIFNYYQHITEKAHAALASISAQIPIANFGEFQEACLSDKRMQQKLASIVQQDYFEKLDIAKVQEVIDRHHLSVPIVQESGESKLQFSPDIRHRWALLKLLGDDYLESPMTDLSYEANSKVRIAKRKID